MKPTYPVVFKDPDEKEQWKCEMRDPKTKKIWSMGYGATRQEAIYNARRELPPRSFILRALGWQARHPFLGGFVIGAYLSIKNMKRYEIQSRIFAPAIYKGAVYGVTAWVIQKVARFFKRKNINYTEIAQRMDLPQLEERR